LFSLKTQRPPIKIFEITVLFQIVRSANNYGSRDDRTPTVSGARAINYAIAHCFYIDFIIGKVGMIDTGYLKRPKILSYKFRGMLRGFVI